MAKCPKYQEKIFPMFLALFLDITSIKNTAKKTQ
jgi:hypothetical protein